MSEVKLKVSRKVKSPGKYELVSKSTYSDNSGSVAKKEGMKDYVNEIFAGLIWLG
jgi:hypothetical protein